MSDGRFEWLQTGAARAKIKGGDTYIIGDSGQQVVDIAFIFVVLGPTVIGELMWLQLSGHRLFLVRIDLRDRGQLTGIGSIVAVGREVEDGVGKIRVNIGLML